jgi:hypothetical protein
MPLMLYVIIPLAFLVVQTLLDMMSDGITSFAILIYLQLSFISHMKIYMRGFLFEFIVFSLSYMLCYAAAHNIEAHNPAYIFFSLIFLLSIDFMLFVMSGKSNGCDKWVMIEPKELKKTRLILAAMVAAPFFLVLSLSVPAYYQRVEQAPLIIYVFGFLFGFSFLISKRIAGLYARFKNPM